ncbi:MAG: ABC transporter ATP-binding protein [Methanomassiliicoccales archaeon]|jgi:ABC-2 type transport system ATP-binding protein
MPALEVRNLKKSFGDVQAVKDISFSVEPKEFFGLLGPNGAGKTTSIRMITGVLKPDAGSVIVEGIDLKRNFLEAKMKMGVIPEVGNIYPDLSARENIELVGRFYGLTKATREDRAEQLLTDLGLKERADDLTRKFSKGMRQRVSIACAMVHEPSILILDEPTEGLDVMSRRLIVDKVKEMNRKGSTVILTTHNIEEASRLCHRVCIVNKGSIVAIDTPDRLRRTTEMMQMVEVAFDRKVEQAWFLTGYISRAELCNDKWRFYADDLDKAIEQIVKVKEAQGLKILSMSTSGPTLEDVFVKLCEVH